MEWISVKDRLPELTEQVYWYNDENERVPWEGKFETHVLVYEPNGGIMKAKLSTLCDWQEIGTHYSNGTIKPSHWMPLPPIPKD